MQAGLRLVSKVAGLWLAVFAVTAVIPHASVLLPSLALAQLMREREPS